MERSSGRFAVDHLGTLPTRAKVGLTHNDIQQVGGVNLPEADKPLQVIRRSP